MPKNNDLTPVTLPMELKFDKGHSTEFTNDLDAIKVTLRDAPSWEQLRSYLADYVEATWGEQPIHDTTDEEKDQLIMNIFQGKALPTSLETIGLTFSIEGLSVQDVTHLIRHRTMSFSAQCTGDRWQSDAPAVVPAAVQQSDELYARWKKHVEEGKQLYCDMIDTRKISIMDARTILPKCISSFYWARVNIKDCFAFIKQRIDKQIQPCTDNIIAYQMFLEILRKYPMLVNCIDIHAASWFYAKMARSGKATNLYYPDADSDTFEWNENDFIYQCTREEMNGTNEDAKHYFSEKIAAVDAEIEEIRKQAKKDYPHLDL